MIPGFENRDSSTGLTGLPECGLRFAGGTVWGLRIWSWEFWGFELGGWLASSENGERPFQGFVEHARWSQLRVISVTCGRRLWGSTKQTRVP